MERKGRSIRTDRHIPLSMYYDAYYSFRKHCRKTEAQQAFEASYSYNLFSMRRDVVERHIALGTSYAFIVKKPRPREVFAGSVYKRILDRLCMMVLKPSVDGMFSERHYNVRKGFGLLQYQQRLQEDMREAMEDAAVNRTEEPWILGGDVSSYFMSMDKDIVWRKWEVVIREWYGGEYMNELLYIMKEIVYYEPEKHCVRLSSDDDWKLIPPHKSLFTNGNSRGMPIGDFVSQYTALLLLRDFCFFLEESFGRVGVYMDDWYAIGDHEKLLTLIPLSREKLRVVGLRLNERKTYLQPIRHGIKMCGSFVYPNRAYVSNRTVNNAMQTMFYYCDRPHGCITHMCQRMNSYFGILRHFKSYNIRKRLINVLPTEWWEKVCVTGHYEKFVVKKYNYLKKKEQ